MADTFDIFINDSHLTFDQETTLAEAVQKFEAKPPYVLLVNNQFVPASQHNQTRLSNNDRIEIISAIQGG